MSSKLSSFKTLISSIPEFCTSHWLLRMPLVIIFLQQGLMKLPFDLDEASSYGLPPLVWWIVIAGEIGAGLGLLLGGLFNTKILACTLVTKHKDFELGKNLKSADKKVYLNHPFCSQFCVLGNSSCS